jgi:hypothetical protein
LGIKQAQFLVGPQVRSNVDRLRVIDHPGAVSPDALTRNRPDHPLRIDLRSRRHLQLIAYGLRDGRARVPGNLPRIPLPEVRNWSAEHHTRRGRGHRTKPGADDWTPAQQLLMSRLFADSRLKSRLHSLAADLLIEVFLKRPEGTDTGRTSGEKQRLRTTL